MKTTFILLFLLLSISVRAADVPPLPPDTQVTNSFTLSWDPPATGNWSWYWVYTNGWQHAMTMTNSFTVTNAPDTLTTYEIAAMNVFEGSLKSEPFVYDPEIRYTNVIVTIVWRIQLTNPAGVQKQYRLQSTTNMHEWVQEPAIESVSKEVR